MTSSAPDEAFVWIWLPGAAQPVVAGRLVPVGNLIEFNYGRSYLERGDAIPIYLPELPLRRGVIAPPAGLRIAGCIDDAGPDAWGQRVIMQHILGTGATDGNPADLHPLTYLLRSGSDRIGALDFQESADTYVSRDDAHASLEELMQAADRVDQRLPLSPALDRALLHGSSIGGARPKALFSDGARKLIAKFSSTTDSFSVVKGEFIAMELARRVGLDVARVELVELVETMGKDVLLVERFDREASTGTRRAVVSALTMLSLDEMMARYASYADLAEIVRRRFVDAPATLRELFARITFNVLVGNTDDHARNHSAFWDGADLSLTPAYDICPQGRAGGESSQAMVIGPDGFRMSRLAGCVRAASTYLLDEAQAREIIDGQIAVIESEWDDVCEVGRLTEVDRDYFWRRQFLNPYALEGYGSA
jgi:serine/threonine-protein kinase HipA